MKDKKPKKDKVEEPASLYEKTKLEGIGEDFDFDKEFEKGYTIEEARAISIKKIREWWGK